MRYAIVIGILWVAAGFALARVIGGAARLGETPEPDYEDDFEVDELNWKGPVG